MIGDMVLHAANRATHGAVDDLARKATWAVVGLFLAFVGCVFALFVAFWELERYFNPEIAGAIIAGGCFVVAFLCFAIPRAADIAKRRRAQSAPAAQTLSAVQEEVSEAVDHFGPLRVVASSFMLGFGTARRLKHSFTRLTGGRVHAA